MKSLFGDPYAVAVFFSLLLWFLLKEMGARRVTLDTIWDSALARNIAETEATTFIGLSQNIILIPFLITCP